MCSPFSFLWIFCYCLGKTLRPSLCYCFQPFCLIPSCSSALKWLMFWSFKLTIKNKHWKHFRTKLHYQDHFLTKQKLHPERLSKDIFLRTFDFLVVYGSIIWVPLMVDYWPLLPHRSPSLAPILCRHMPLGTQMVWSYVFIWNPIIIFTLTNNNPFYPHFVDCSHNT